MTQQVVSVSDADFRRQILKSDEPVLVAFRANWCVPSQDLVPVVDAIAKKYTGRARVVSVEMGPSTQKLCSAYQVNRVPVVMVFKDGGPRDFIGGATDEATIVDMLEKQLKPVVDLSEGNFEMEVLKSDLPVLVHFWAPSCQSSLELNPDVDSLAAKFRGRAKVARLELRPDTARLCAFYNIKRLPTTVVFHKGEIQDRIFGAMTGGTKGGAVKTSCVGLTSFDNLAQMLEPFTV